VRRAIIFAILLAFILNHMSIQIQLDVAGENFNSNVRVDDTGVSITKQERPNIAILDNKVYITWYDNRSGLDHIYFTKSTDGGKSFDNNVRVDDAPINKAAACPSIAVDNSNNNIYVVWQDYRNSPSPYSVDIYFANSTDGGNNFNNNKRIIDETGSNYQNVPCIAARNGFIGVVWEDQRGGIYFTNSTDAGNSFGENKRVNDFSGTGFYYPKIAIDPDDTIYVVWEDNPEGKFYIYFSKSTDGGNTFTSQKKVSDDPTTDGQRMPSIAVGSDGDIYIVWRDYRTSDSDIYDIYFTKSTDSGDNFISANQVTDDPGDAEQHQPSIAVNDDGKIFVSWLDQREGGYNIYFANSTNGGNSFNTNLKVNDGSNISPVYSPSNAVAAKGNHAFIVWQDDRKGDWDIYFSRSNWEPPMTTPIIPPIGSKITLNEPNLQVDTIFDQDNDTTYYNFTISDEPDAESGTVYYSGWITSTSWKPPPLPDGIWYWHTYTYDGFNITSPNWVWNFTIDTSQGYSIPLFEGWNLISIPFIQMDTNLESVFDSINGSYDAVQWYNADDNSDHWKHNHISKPSQLNDMRDIDHKMAIWVHITQPGGVLFECSGIILTENQTISLKTGWNLLGYPSLSNKTRDVAMNNLTFNNEIDAIWTYNTSTKLWRQIDEFDNFERGRGYWIHAKTDCVWEVPL
jgi:hypothetical protein